MSEHPAGERAFANRRWRNSLQARLEIPLLVRLLSVPPERDVLETGCGRGVGLVALARTCRPASLTGVDIDGDLVRIARARCAARHVAADLVQGDVRELPFPDESFDIVIDFGTLHHVRPARQALSEVERVLRIGGVLVHETQLSQMLAHPVRSSRSRLLWQFAPQLAPVRVAGLWACRIKEAGPVTGAMQ